MRRLTVAGRADTEAAGEPETDTGEVNTAPARLEGEQARADGSVYSEETGTLDASSTRELAGLEAFLAENRAALGRLERHRGLLPAG